MTDRVDVAIGGLLVAGAAAIAIGRQIEAPGDDDRDQPVPTAAPNSKAASGD